MKITEETISERIKLQRLNKGYSLRKLSELSGVPHITILDIEKGRYKPSFQSVVKIMDGLGLQLDLVRKSKQKALD